MSPSQPRTKISTVLSSRSIANGDSTDAHGDFRVKSKTNTQYSAIRVETLVAVDDRD